MTTPTPDYWVTFRVLFRWMLIFFASVALAVGLLTLAVLSFTNGAWWLGIVALVGVVAVLAALAAGIVTLVTSQ